MAFMAYWISRTRPGKAAAHLEIAKEQKRIAEAHGAKVSIWSLQGSHSGQLLFVLEADSAEAYGRGLDGIVADPAFQASMARNDAEQVSEWTEHNYGHQLG